MSVTFYRCIEKKAQQMFKMWGFSGYFLPVITTFYYNHFIHNKVKNYIKAAAYAI